MDNRKPKEERSFFKDHGVTRAGKIIREIAQGGKTFAPILLDLAEDVPGVGTLKKIIEFAGGDDRLNTEETTQIIDSAWMDINDIVALNKMKVETNHEIEMGSLKSENKFVRFARPSRIYVQLALIIFCFIVWPLLHGVTMKLPMEVIAFFGVDSLGYTIARSKEKIEGKAVPPINTIIKNLTKRNPRKNNRDPLPGEG